MNLSSSTQNLMQTQCSILPSITDKMKHEVKKAHVKTKRVHSAVSHGRDGCSRLAEVWPWHSPLLIPFCLKMISRNIIFLLIYHRHSLLELIYLTVNCTTQIIMGWCYCCRLRYEAGGRPNSYNNNCDSTQHLSGNNYGEIQQGSKLDDQLTGNKNQVSLSCTHPLVKSNCMPGMHV
jgi:hypothetical protein